MSHKIKFFSDSSDEKHKQSEIVELEWDEARLYVLKGEAEFLPSEKRESQMIEPPSNEMAPKIMRGKRKWS